MWSDCSLRSRSPTTLTIILVFFLIFFICPSADSFLYEHTIMKYHNGVVITADISINIIWYGEWKSTQKGIIRDFLNSISATNNPSSPSVSDWWKNVRVYTDQNGSNVSGTVRIASERNYMHFFYGKVLTRGLIESVMTTIATSQTEPLSVHPNGDIYLFLTSEHIYVPDFCRNKCGSYHSTSVRVAGKTLPYVWVGNSHFFCPEICAYPFDLPIYYTKYKRLKSPNGDLGMDGMVGVIAAQIVEYLTNPFGNGWYSGPDQDGVSRSCQGIYGRNGHGTYVGDVFKDNDGASYNVHGMGRRFLLPWLWNYVLNDCSGPY